MRCHGSELAQELAALVSADAIWVHEAAGEQLVEVKAGAFVSEQAIAKLNGAFAIRAVKRLSPVLPVLSRKDTRVPCTTWAEMLAHDAGRNLPLWKMAAEYEMARGHLTEAEVIAKMVDIVRMLRRSIAQGIAGTRYDDRVLGHQCGQFNDLMKAGRLLDGGALNRIKRSGLDKYPYTTNQMLTVTISNVFGVEAWNSYSNAFPRDLQMIVVVDTTATITNQYSQILLSNRMARGSSPVLMANSWGGYPKTGSAQASFKAPWDVSTNGFLFLTNSTYHHGTRRFIGLTGIFESPSGDPVPQWWLQLHTKVRYILVDTGSRQIVDYVNLDSAEDPIDLGAALSSDGQCGDSYVQDGAPGSMWCTNRGVGVISDAVPTFGYSLSDQQASIAPLADQESH